MTIGQRIRAERKKAGLTQEQLGKATNLSAITIHQYESEKRQPRIKSLQAIANALGIPLTDLTGETNTSSETDSRFENRLLSAFHQLNDKGQQIATERVEELTRISEYKDE